MTRLDILAQLPTKVRELIRRFESNIEDCEIEMMISSKDYASTYEKLKNDNEEHIHDLLSLTYSGAELENAFQVIREGHRKSLKASV